jgi:hypothetical protein
MSKRVPALNEPTTPVTVVAWRTERLQTAGRPGDLALGIARDRYYDLHALLELVDRGCPAELAIRIRAPVDEHGARC